MSRPPGVRRLLRLRHRKWIEHEVDAELEHHLEMRVDELVESGIRPDEARRMAEAAFGDRGSYRSACVSERRREVRMGRARELFGQAASDVRYALRGIRKAPGFASAVVLTLGLGIGANSAIFTVVDTLLIRDLPYPEPDELHQIHVRYSSGFMVGDFRYATAAALRGGSPRLQGGHLDGRLSAVRSDGPEPVTLTLEALEPGLADMLGSSPLLGRPFNPEDGVPGAGQVALLSYGYWSGALGADADAVGHTLLLDSVPVTVVGVMPRSFRFPLYGETDAYVPLATDGTALGRPIRSVSVTLRVAEAEVARTEQVAETVAAGIREQNPGGDEWTAMLAPLNEPRTSRDVKRALYVTFGAVAIMLLVALVNGVNLMLVRGSARAREIGVRLALGGGRRRIVAQLVTESLVLALVSGVVAVVLANVGVDALWAMAPRDLRFFAPNVVEVDGRVLVYTGALAVVTGVVFGLIPALRAVARAAAPGSVSIGAHGNLTRARQRSRAALVVAQVALSLTLLFGAGLMGRSFARLVRQDPGMELQGLVSAVVDLSPGRYRSPEERRAFMEGVRGRLEGVPGVTAVAVGHGQLPSGGVLVADGLYLEGRTDPVATGTVILPRADADPGLRATMGTELLAGRDLTADDAAAGRRVLITESLARRLGARTPAEGVGLRFGMDADEPAYEAVGVIEDARLDGLDPFYPKEALLRVFDGTEPPQSLGLLIRTDGPVAPIFGAVRAAVHDVDPGQPIAELRTVEEAFRRSVQKPRFFATLMVVFAGVGLALAGVGLYGVLSFAVSQRTREMGIRVALGAASRDVRGLVLRRGVGLAAIGVLIGCLASLGAGRVMDGLLFETSARDALTLATTTALLLGVAALASWVPARRATRVDPARVLGVD